MTYDAHKNFAYSTVAAAPVPASSGTALTLAAGDGAKMPAAPFNLVIWPTGAQPLVNNAEVVRVTLVVGDVLTIVRAQEGSNARAVIVGDQVMVAITAKSLQDIEAGAAGIGFTSTSIAGSVIGGTLNTSGLSLGVPNYLTTADLSQNSSLYAKTGFTTTTIAGSVIAGTQDTNGLKLAVPAFLTTAAGGGGSVNFSAGTTSSGLNSVVFSNSNNVSFGLNGSTITGSIPNTYAGSGFTTTTVAGAVVAGTQNSNGLLLAVPAYLTTADLSANSSLYAGTGFTSTTVAGAVPTGTLATNGLKLGMPSYLTTAALSQNSSLYAGTGITTTTTTGTNVVGTLNTSGLSLGVPAFLTTDAAQTAQTVGLYALGNTTQNSSTTLDARSLSFNAIGGASIGYSNGSIQMSIPQTSSMVGTNGISVSTNGSTISISGLGITISAGNTSSNFNSIVFSNSNGVSFGLNGSTITASAAPGANINLSAGTTSNNLSNFVLSNSNNVSFGLSGSTVTATVTVATSLTNVVFAGMSGLNVVGSTISTSQINLGQNNNALLAVIGSTIFAALQAVSSYENMPGGLSNSQTMTWNGASVSHAVAFYVPMPGNASFIRIPASFSTNSTTYGTTAASLSASVEQYSTFNAVLYSLGTGANSKSLQSVASGSVGWTNRNSISVAANGTQYSLTQAISYGVEGVNTNTSTQYSISNTNYSFVSTAWQSLLSGLRFLDINFNNTLSAGAYWLVVGLSTSSATNSTGISLASNANVNYSNHFGVAQPNVVFGVLGATNQTSGGLLGAGSFSTAGGGTTNSIPISAISSSASNVRPYLQLLRSA